MKLKFLAVLCIGALYSCNQENILDNNNNIDPNSLRENSIYDGPATQLIKKEIKNSPANTSTKDLENCVDVSEHQEKTFDHFSRLGTGASLMWPGNIVQGKTIKTGQLASIPIGDNGRNSIEVKVDAFSSSPTIPSSQLITDPTPGKVQTALQSMLNGFYDSGTNFPANYSIDIQRTFNSKQLQIALNVGYTGAIGMDVGGSFGINFNTSKTYYAVTLKQKFFEVSVNPKTGLKGNDGWITNSYPQAQLDQYIAADNPAVYISSVTYGRLYTLVYESDEKATKIEQALNFAYKNPTANISASQKTEFSTTLQNARVYVKQLGGSATAGLEASLGTLAGNFDSVRNFVVTGAEVSKTNPGYPIEYSAVNIGSNLPVTVKVEDQVNYQNCTDNGYKLILKNMDYATLPVVLRTENNWNNSVYYLASGEQVVLPYNANLMQFTYNGSPLEEIDLNNGSSADDIKFYKTTNTQYSKTIYYRRQNFGLNTFQPLFLNYPNIANTTAYTIIDHDGINGGPAAKIEATKDTTNNALKIEIKRK
ncbi:thiol-activated cytolysin [Chryseobacterium nematophagum]|uniref:Thiol-activated cytolysin n=1 Tax=Chryseobacterium nematophagum TaxID=2305228 RepID=A0A3M7LGC3_9FLAO|nr:thiol-activated cytolysin family protein [Chryseobacterium nematophagum]RMZ61155.1 thiol-activated cytolysin [Chryseobacterium nematophagum]